MTDALPDALRPGLRLVFVGTAASDRSRARGQYYGGPGNRFWSTLGEAGFIPTPLGPAEWRLVDALGIGFTDLAKVASGTDRRLMSADFDLPRFRAAMGACTPQAVAFTSKAAAGIALGQPARRLSFGEVTRDHSIPGVARLFVLPSPSGSNGHWMRCGAEHWKGAARAMGFA